MMRQSKQMAAAFGMCAMFGSLGAPSIAAATDAAKPYRVETVISGLDHPWGIAFLADGSMLVTERPGRLRVIRNGALEPSPVADTPKTFAKSQGGYFDVVLHPRYAETGWVYLVFSSGEANANATTIMRGKLNGNAFTDQQVIYTAAPLKNTSNHFGGRMVFLSDGTFLVAVGDGFEYREEAQNAQNDLGKILRLNDDGTIPADNPFANREDASGAVWTLGHRNQQGLVVDPATGAVYAHEHGPQGGDELNLIEKGKNYGWPLITYGMDYSGAYVSPYKERQGLEQPLVQWTPSIAPSGLALYTGDKFPAWQGDLFVGALAFKQLVRVDMENGAVKNQEVLLKELNARIRTVAMGPDGYLYVLTDDTDGKVLRLVPAP